MRSDEPVQVIQGAIDHVIDHMTSIVLALVDAGQRVLIFAPEPRAVIGSLVSVRGEPDAGAEPSIRESDLQAMLDAADEFANRSLLVRVVSDAGDICVALRELGSRTLGHIVVWPGCVGADRLLEDPILAQLVTAGPSSMHVGLVADQE